MLLFISVVINYLDRANDGESPALVIFFVSLACFGNGLASITWWLVSAIAPAITFIAMTALAAAICYGLVVGNVERIISCPEG